MLARRSYRDVAERRAQWNNRRSLQGRWVREVR